LLSEIDPIARIHRGLSRETAGLLAQCAGTNSVIIRFFFSEHEFRRRFCRLPGDFFMLGKFWLPANTCVRGIVDTRLTRRVDLPGCGSGGN
jgi:hypothetical protein